jgi:hypothetical protein
MFLVQQENIDVGSHELNRDHVVVKPRKRSIQIIAVPFDQYHSSSYSSIDKWYALALLATQLI